MKYGLILIAFILGACATHDITPAGQLIDSSRDYAPIIDKNSDRVRRYSGFYNILDAEGTLLTTTVLEAQVQQNALLYQWDESKIASERSKAMARTDKETELFLSFFTPERKNNDLAKTNTIWKVFLDANGRRYEGSVSRIRISVAELEGLYPYYNRFYIPYSVKFPVAVKSLEGRPVKVTITGTIGSGTLDFGP